MKFCLFSCAAINVLAGTILIAAFDFVIWLMGIKPISHALPIQMLGVFYLVRGYGIGVAAFDLPARFGQLFPVLLTMIGCFIFSGMYIAIGQISFAFLPVVLATDFVFALPIWMIISQRQKWHKNERRKRLDSTLG